MNIDTLSIARLNKIIAEARKAIEVIRRSERPAKNFDRIAELAEGYPS